MKKSVIFDTDPGIDDAVALALALKCDNMDIKLITTVAGNVGIEHTTRNALGLLETYNRSDIPVARGASEPLIVKYEDASAYHGKTGLGSVFYENLKNKAYDNAVYEMKKLIDKEGKITIIAIGPLTNIALLLKTYEDVKDKIDEIIIMGGAIARGNMTVYAEYNIGADPHSAYIVFNSGIKLTMLGLEMGDNAKISEADMDKLESKTGKFLARLFKDYKGAKFNGYASVYDATAIAYFDDPSIYKTKKCFVDVEIEGKYTKGATIVDIKNISGKEPNVYVPYEIDSKKFRDWFIEKLSRD